MRGPHPGFHVSRLARFNPLSQASTRLSTQTGDQANPLASVACPTLLPHRQAIPLSCTRCVHHPYTIRTPSVQDPYTMRTPWVGYIAAGGTPEARAGYRLEAGEMSGRGTRLCEDAAAAEDWLDRRASANPQRCPRAAPTAPAFDSTQTARLWGEHPIEPAITLDEGCTVVGDL